LQDQGKLSPKEREICSGKKNIYRREENIYFRITLYTKVVCKFFSDRIQNMKDFKRVFSFFKPFLLKYRLLVVGSIVFIIVSNLLSSTVPLFYRKLIDMVDTANIDNFHSFISVLLMLFGIKLLGMIFSQVNNYIVANVQSHIIRDLNQSSYDIIAQQDYHFFMDSFVGSLVAKVSKFGKAFYTIYDTLIWQVIGSSASLILIFIVLLRSNLILGLTFTTWSIFYGWVSIRFVDKHAQLENERSKSETTLAGFMSDIFTNILNIKVFSSAGRERDLFSETNQDVFSKRLKSWYYSNFVFDTSRGIQFIFELSVILVAVYLWSRGEVTTGTIVLLLLYINQVMMQLMYLSHSLRRLVEGISDSIEVIDILSTEQLVNDKEFPSVVAMERGTIEFKNVSFEYPGGDHVFDNFSLTIPYGQSVGIVGSSGSGKTTVTKLLLRFFDVNGGSITVDGQDIRDVSQDDLRSRIAYVPQESILFHRSIYENIAYANPLASKEEVYQAAEHAHAVDFINDLAFGYDTLVGERGIKLSGGQRQRIAIARAMLKKSAPILVMDEATSSLDSISEQVIQDAFDELKEHRTTLVIAHRLSTVQKVDRIIVLKDGKIIEDGNHQKLLANNGEYALLWNTQLGKNEDSENPDYQE